MRSGSTSAPSLGANPREFTPESEVTGNPALIEVLREEIRAHGGISFARLMELALYHPRLGYYASGRARIGRAGDFFTNVSVGPLFGRFLAAQFAEMWEKLERPDEFALVEQGAHDGTLAEDILAALEKFSPACFAVLRYSIVEPFSFWHDRQQGTLQRHRTKIQWFASVADLPPFVGVHFSNELFDAMPVRRFSRLGSEWKELFAVEAGAGLAFEEREIGAGSRPVPMTIDVTGHYMTEVSKAGPQLMCEIAGKILRGVILVIDYGFTRRDYYSPDRNEGTLQVRAHHQKLASPLLEIGQADLSAHVEWNSLIDAAEGGGALLLGLTDQHHFLTGIASNLLPPDEIAALGAKERRALQTLLHPEMLGRSFQVLGLGKNFTTPISGFRFNRSLI